MQVNDTQVGNLDIEQFVSPKIAWYNDKLNKKWQIVYKIKPSKEHIGCWIVSNCHRKCFTIKQNDLLSIPPTNGDANLSIKQIISITMYTIGESLEQIHVWITFHMY